MSKCKLYCVSFKLKAVESAEKKRRNQKKPQRDNLVWVLRDSRVVQPEGQASCDAEAWQVQAEATNWRREESA